MGIVAAPVEKVDEMDEMTFRLYAALCWRCGKSRRETGSDICGNCEYNDSLHAGQSTPRLRGVSRLTIHHRRSA
jgi:hypothetical protein